MVQTIRIKMMDKNVKVALSENMITHSTIKSAFLLADDAVVSLSYELDKCPVVCESRIVPEPCFLLPGGWSAMQFFVESNKMPSRLATPIDQALNARSISPYYPALPPDPAPASKSFIKWMFFLHDHVGKATTICVHPRFFVTFRHGTHLQFKLGDELTMYSAEKEVREQTGVKVCVVNVNEALDFVLLKSQSDVVDRGPSIARAQESEPFTLAGFDNDQGTLSYLSGTIHSVRDFYSTLEGDVRQMGPFILGTGQSSGGDSGGGIWGSRGLIGMNVACTTMPLKVHTSAISEAAVFSPKNVISPAFRFKDAYMQELEKERQKENVASPPHKEPHFMVEFEGIGTGYGNLD